MIEKCYAIFRGGSYESIFNVKLEDIIMDLSGTPSETINLEQHRSEIIDAMAEIQHAGDPPRSLSVKEVRDKLQPGDSVDFGSDRVWNMLLSAANVGAVVICGNWVWARAGSGADLSPTSPALTGAHAPASIMCNGPTPDGKIGFHNNSPTDDSGDTVLLNDDTASIPFEKLGDTFNRLDICQALPTDGSCALRTFSSSWDGEYGGGGYCGKLFCKPLV